MQLIHYPKVSVIILNWNGLGYIEKCLDSVLASNYPKELLEVIVVDNGSSDGSIEVIRKYYPEVRLIENKSNLGFCIGNNIGIKNSTGDLVILLNNDTIVDKDWIINIVREAGDSKVGIIGCILVNPVTNRIQTLGCKELFTCFWESIGHGKIFSRKINVGGKEVDYVSGAALAIKREVLRKIGLLDPLFHSYVEDVDLCYRAKRAGYKVVMSNAIVYHYKSLSWSMLPIKKLYLVYRNKTLFIIKNYKRAALIKYFLKYPIQVTFHYLKRAPLYLTDYNNARFIFLKRVKNYLFNLFFFYLGIALGLRLAKLVASNCDVHDGGLETHIS